MINDIISRPRFNRILENEFLLITKNRFYVGKINY